MAATLPSAGTTHATASASRRHPRLERGPEGGWDLHGEVPRSARQRSPVDTPRLPPPTTPADIRSGNPRRAQGPRVALAPDRVGDLALERLLNDQPQHQHMTSAPHRRATIASDR